ncbi:MAG: hypothetical protein ABUS49_04795 [Acidobacteriota bacterium]
MTDEDDDAPILTFRQVKGLLGRRGWLLLLTTCASAAATIAFAYHLPDRFTSEATLLVVEQQVPQRYVTPTSSLGIADELQAMTQEVLSRKRLLELIERFGLYGAERQRLAPEEVIELMRKHISIEPLEPTAGNKKKDADFNAFKISFSADKAILAQEVTSRLTSLFIQENLKMREDQATTTTNFLHEHLEAAKSTLTTQEERLRDFKMQNLGELPEQQQSNLTILNGAQLQLQNTAASLARAPQQRTYMESMLDGYRRLSSRAATRLSPQGSPEPGRAGDPRQLLEADLIRLRTSRAQMMSVYRERHPEVVALDREISAKQDLLHSLRIGAVPAASPALEGSHDARTAPANAPLPEETPEDTSIAQLKSQLDANSLEIQTLSKDEAQQKQAVAQYQRRLNLTPVREQQLAGLLRDYELSKQEYLDLLGKDQQSQLAMSLEKRQGGQQFRLAEAPSLPTLPSSPKRLKIAAGGAAGGLLLGFLLALFVEIRNPTLHDEPEVRRLFSVPLIVGLPLLLTPAQERRRMWRKAFGRLTGALLVLGLAAAQYYVYRHP